jgi:hypothetical protein
VLLSKRELAVNNLMNEAFRDDLRDGVHRGLARFSVTAYDLGLWSGQLSQLWHDHRIACGVLSLSSHGFMRH